MKQTTSMFLRLQYNKIACTSSSTAFRCMSTKVPVTTDVTARTSAYQPPSEAIDPFRKHTSKYLDEVINFDTKVPSKSRLKDAGSLGKQEFEDVYKGQIGGLSNSGARLAGGITNRTLSSMNRFYKDVTVEQYNGQYTVCLDGKKARTPATRRYVCVDNENLAYLLGTEWAMQKGKFDPSNMPLTTLVATTLDTPEVAYENGSLVDECMQYLETDTVRIWEKDAAAGGEEGGEGEDQRKLFEADNSPEYLNAHEEEWGPILEWFAEEFNSPPLAPVRGYAKTEPVPVVLDTALRNYLTNMNPWILQSVTSACRGAKSIILAIALEKRYKNVEEVFHLSRLDEELQCEQWGVVEGGHDLDRAHLRVQLSAASTVMWYHSK